MMDVNATNLLTEKIGRLGLSGMAEKALYELALDPHGFEQGSAPSLIASMLDIRLEVANQVLLELSSRRLLLETSDVGRDRLVVDYEHLGLDDSVKQRLLQSHDPLEDEGEPHSVSAMRSLEELFDADTTICLALEVTSHHVFKKLEDRAVSGKKTIFLVPKKSDVPDHRKNHYDEVLEGWTNFIKNGPKALKENVRIRVTEKAFPELYTSAISQDIGRFDIYFFHSKTTRRGKLFQVKSGTSLYKLLEKRYEEALCKSYPMWSLWRKEAALYWLKWPSIEILLIAVIIGLVGKNEPWTVILWATAVGILANILYNLLGQKPWQTPQLFKKQ